MINVLHATGDIEVVARDMIERLKELARQHPAKRSRLCLHHDISAPTHEMIIVVHKSSYLRPHRHPAHKSESYHVIEGEMEVRIFSAGGDVRQLIRLTPAGSGGDAFMYRVTNGAWHQPVPITEWVVYHETFTGPFSKEADVEYAAWAPAETWQDALPTPPDTHAK